MKHLIIAVISAVVTVLVIIILMSVHSADLKQTELERSLKSAARQSLENACLSQKTQVSDNDTLVCDFIGIFLGKMKINERVVSENGEIYAEDSSDKGGKLEIDIEAADIYKGILSVRVKEHFTYPNGKIGTIKAETTQIVERESRRPSEYVNYYIPWQIAKAAGFDYSEESDFLFYQQQYAAGYDGQQDINAPRVSGYSFVKWKEKRKEKGVTEYIALYE